MNTTDTSNMDRPIPQEVRRRRRVVRISIVAGVATAVVILAMSIGRLAMPRLDARSLMVGEVDSGSIDVSITASGRVVPAFELTITSPISSQILEVYAHSGDTVDVGTPLMRLDLEQAEIAYSRELDEHEIRHQTLLQQEANIASQRADRQMQLEVEAMKLSQLEAELRNEQYLDSLGSGTKNRVRQAETALYTARLNLEALRRQAEGEVATSEAQLRVKHLQDRIADKSLHQSRRTLSQANIRATRRATLTYINSEIGSMVGAGSKLATLSDLSSFKIECTIADTYSDRVVAGGRVQARIGRDVLEGTISSVTPLSQNGAITFNAVMDNPSHPRLRSGLKVEIYVITSMLDDVIRLPNGSYYSGPGTYTLYVFTADDMVVPRQVKLGECNYSHVEVIEGLAAGERVIISDMTKWKGHDKIKISN